MKRLLRNWSLIATTVLASGLLIGPGQAWGRETVPLSAAETASPALASNYGVYECLYNDQTQCLDVKDNHFAQGQPIWMFSSSGGNALGWTTLTEGYVTNSWPFSNTSLDSKYKGDETYEFHKTTTTGLLSPYCLGESSGVVELDKNCGSTTGTWWVKDGNELVNVLRSDYLGGTRVLMTSSTANDTIVEVGTVSGWYQWKVRTCC